VSTMFWVLFSFTLARFFSCLLVLVLPLVVQNKHPEISLFSNHIIHEVEAVCDRVLFINEGRLLGQGTVDELKADAGVPDGNLEDAFAALVEQASAERRQG